MLTENDVIDAVCGYLHRSGYEVRQRLTTKQRGIDITAVHHASGVEFFVEAKGGTPSGNSTKRSGQAFSAAQVRVHVGEVFHQAARLCTPECPTRKRIAIAVPDTPLHRRLVNEIHFALGRLAIEVLLVDEAREVKVL